MKEESGNSIDFLKELLLVTHHVVFAYDAQKEVFIYLNRAFEEVFKIAPDKAATNPILLHDLIHPEDVEYVVETYQQIMDGMMKKRFEFRALIDGNIKHLMVVPYMIRHEGNPVFCGFVEDITLSSTLLTLQKKHTAKKNAILEILSHDLAGPLKNIHQLSQRVYQKIEKHEDPELHLFIQSIQKTSMRSIELIQEFVNSEFLDSTMVDVKKHPVNIVLKVQEVFDQYRDAEDLIKKEFKFFPSAESIIMELDEVKFMQVINNLISNAIKFTPDDGKISVTLEEKGETILFIVEDNGVGIPKDRLPFIFDKFSRARRPGLRGEPSVGLGMSIIKTIVEWHNGKVWLESEENKGTKVFVEIPRR